MALWPLPFILSLCPSPQQHTHHMWPLPLSHSHTHPTFKKCLLPIPQVPRKRHSHRQTSVGSSVLSAASDSGVGGDTWAANDLTTPANTDRLHDYVQRQNTIHSRLPERERTAHAAAIALISNSPKPDSLSPYPGLAQQQRDMERQQQQQRRQVGHFSSNDDSSSVFTITSQSSTSDLFIPRRTQRQYADSDDQQHFSK